ncbi:MAG: hypothetical protein OXC68_03415 [Aestuariivita sp.]|nr:hypothetical protein [Aestuariivita sp.]
MHRRYRDDRQFAHERDDLCRSAQGLRDLMDQIETDSTRKVVVLICIGQIFL